MAAVRILEEHLPELKKKLYELQQLCGKEEFQFVNNASNAALGRVENSEWEQLINRFNNLSDLFGQHATQIQDTIAELTCIIHDIMKIKSTSSYVAYGLPSSQSQLEGDPDDVFVRKASREWGDLGIEEKMLKSSVITDLRLSFDYLTTPELKLCLLCFSVFPENAVIKKRELIYWWIGEGFVTTAGDKTAEEIGHEYIRELMNNHLIEPFPEIGSQEAKCCKMHPWVRQMVISVAKEAQFFDFYPMEHPTSENNERSGSRLETSSRSRRACLATTSRQGSPDLERLYHKELLTLFNVDACYLDFRTDTFSRMTKLVVLQLGRWKRWPKHHIEVEDTGFLEGLRGMKHLRYLSLQGISRITNLPASISKLTHLTILDLRACHNLEELPPELASLKNLTHLDLSDCYLIEYVPKGIGSFSELQVLKGFVIGNSKINDSCTLSELVELQRLRKLSINIASDAVVAEGEFDKLQQLKDLRSLTITWALKEEKQDDNGIRSSTDAVAESLDSISFPTGLKKLDLRCIPREEAPNWLEPRKLENLEKLYIRGGKLNRLLWDQQDPTWKKVRVLRLRFLDSLEMEWTKLRRAFPCLEYLNVVNCPRLRRFPCNAQGDWEKRKNHP
ncbi:PREDICTED: disease resistance RPP13-like protein 4 [Nelumbo nucifera]|uniref:Disease resistance RPP13-like protein 4 n=2 Tax=Nelumbo nucifera TaxID=4432 RepID=A0A1U8QC71_NELNU|nr:PREDICTED: disease resistance RPP13-like protein 4 [Nelumbo nucifera]DAD20742.1 TPA_asm: hypothetical protein HUJ06_022205 [Nelumbo nucifera]